MFGERRFRLPLLSPLAVLLWLLASPGAAGVSASEATTAAQPCDYLVRFDDHNFPDRPSIDNGFLPMVPGTQHVLTGTVDGVFHRVTFTVTDLTKEIDGVTTLVIWDRDENEGEVLESELTFFAQDNAGNVWNLGEYPEEFQDGEFGGAPNTWIAGEEGAQAGIHMPARPQVGMSFYLQGFAPQIDFLDCARVAQMGQDVLVTEETNPNDPDGGTQLKYHEPGMGIVKIEFLNPGSGDEVLDLTERKQLSREELRAARSEALRLDRRGYGFSEVYAETEPARLSAAIAESTPISPQAVDGIVRDHPVVQFDVAIVDPLNKPRQEGRDRGEPGPGPVHVRGSLSGSRLDQRHVRGQSPVTALTNGDGVAHFQSRAVQQQSHEPFFQAWLREPVPD